MPPPPPPTLFTHPPSSLAAPPPSSVVCRQWFCSARTFETSTYRRALETYWKIFAYLLSRHRPTSGLLTFVIKYMHACNGNNGRINKGDSSFRVLTLCPSFPLHTASTLLSFFPLRGNVLPSMPRTTDFFSLEYFLAPSPVVTQSGHELHFLTYLYVLGNETMQREISRTGRTFGGSFDTQEENDVVRIYNDSTYSPPKYASYTQHELVCGNKRMLMRSLIIFPFFDEPFFSNNDFTICREKKKEKHTRARTGR